MYYNNIYLNDMNEIIMKYHLISLYMNLYNINK